MNLLKKENKESIEKCKLNAEEYRILKKYPPIMRNWYHSHFTG